MANSRWGEQLLKAVQEGDLLTVDEAIANDPACVNKTKNDEGQTPLMMASGENHTNAAIVKKLIAANAQVDAKDGDGNTALILAGYSGDPKIIEALLSAGANINAKNIAYNTALIAAASMGDKDSVDVLLAHDANVTVRDGDHGRTALMYAAVENHTDIVEAIVHHVAAQYPDEKKRRKALVAAGAEDALNYGSAKERDWAKIPEDALNATPSPKKKGTKKADDRLMHAIEFSSTEEAVALIKSGINVEVRDAAGITPLMLAANIGDVEIVKALVDAGADIYARNEHAYNKGALSYAAENGTQRANMECIEFLIQAISSSNAETEDYKAALLRAGLDHAIEHGRVHPRMYPLMEGALRGERPDMEPSFHTARLQENRENDSNVTRRG